LITCPTQKDVDAMLVCHGYCGGAGGSGVVDVGTGVLSATAATAPPVAVAVGPVALPGADGAGAKNAATSHVRIASPAIRGSP
jgi:hypothetical protein